MSSPRPGARRLPSCWSAAALVLLLALSAARADEPAEALEQLNRAKDLERVQQDPDGALALYEELARRDDLPAVIEADVLAGAARCHEQAGREDAAARYWERIASDGRLPKELRDWAAAKRAEKAKRDAAASAPPPQEDATRALERLRQEERKRSRERVADARAALDGQHFQAATHLCLLALKLDPENAEAQRLLDEIEARRPDPGNVLGRLVQFVQTKELEDFEWLRGEARRLEREARLAFDRKDWQEADRLYREAVARVDDSGFLTLGTTVDTGSLAELRARLISFLRETHTRGAEAGLAFGPEPEAPDLEARKGSGARALFGVLADMFTPREAGGDSLHFFQFAPRPRVGGSKRTVTSAFTGGLRAEHAQGTLNRARWAERWIRRQVGVRWMGASELARLGVDASSRERRRILIRIGELVCADCGEQEQGRIEALQRAFDESPPAVRLDLRLFAVDAAGAVRAAEALRTRAGPLDSGLDHVVAGTLLPDAVALIDGLPGITALGNAQVLLDGETGVQLELTHFTAEHPAYRHVGEPDLTVEDADARYGLWLDLYAEDMPGRREPGEARGALSLRARVTMPDPLHASHVVPRASRANAMWTRRPILLENLVEADRELPHYGTFVLQGLPNPFPENNQERGELLLLVGMTRQDTPTPDPPRTSTDPAIVPAPAVSREYRLGPLSTEVEDQVIPQDWPALRTVAEGLSSEDRRHARDRNLADLLVGMARIDTQAPGGADAVVVQDHLVVTRLDPEADLRLQQALQRLRARENDLYEVSIRSALLPAALWRQWTALEGMEDNGKGNWRVHGPARAALDAGLESYVKREGLFAGARQQLARATQQVAHVQLRSMQVTKDLYRRLLDGNRVRLTAIPGVVEEGLVVEVRPGLEFEEHGVSLRSVHVHARAARLKAVEQHRYPNAAEASAVYDVPVWFPGNRPALSEVDDGELLDDDTLFALPLPYPGDDERRVVVFVGVRRAQ